MSNAQTTSPAITTVAHAAGQTFSTGASGQGELALLDLPDPGISSGAYSLTFRANLAAPTAAPITVFADTGNGFAKVATANIIPGEPSRITFTTCGGPDLAIRHIRVVSVLPSSSSSIQLNDVRVFSHWLTPEQAGLTSLSLAGVVALACAVALVRAFRHLDRARPLALGLSALMVSLVMLGVALAASYANQPAHISAPFANAALFGIAVSVLSLALVRRRLNLARERRRMAAVDV